jgi:SAM-dependent methyltransferase
MSVDTNLAESVPAPASADGVIPQHSCPGCLSERHRLGYKNGYPQALCHHCGVIFTIGAPKETFTQALYDHYYDCARFKIEPASTASLERLSRSFEPFRFTGRWLDVGYGEGALLNIAQSLGWTCHGVEISPQSLEYGRTRGWNVSNDIWNLDFPEPGFDVVTMVEFLEHVTDPGGYLSAAVRSLRPGGLLYLTTPNARSLNRLCLGLDWSIFSPPEHITIWTARGLRSALSREGLACRRIRTDGFNPSEIMTRLHQIGGSPAGISQRFSMSRNEAAFALNAAFSSSAYRRAFKRGVNSCLSALGVGDTLKIWATKENRGKC